MAGINGKRSTFSVQGREQALSPRQLAIGQTNPSPESIRRTQTLAPPRPGSPESPVLAFWGGRLRGENGGRP